MIRETKYYRDKFQDIQDFKEHIQNLTSIYIRSCDINNDINKELKNIHSVFGTIEIGNLIQIIYK